MLPGKKSRFLLIRERSARQIISTGALINRMPKLEKPNFGTCKLNRPTLIFSGKEFWKARYSLCMFHRIKLIMLRLHMYVVFITDNNVPAYCMR